MRECLLPRRLIGDLSRMELESRRLRSRHLLGVSCWTTAWLTGATRTGEPSYCIPVKLALEALKGQSVV